jgi:hypothetical protein
MHNAHEVCYFNNRFHHHKPSGLTKFQRLRAGGGQLVSGQKYILFVFERTGSIEGCSKRRTRSTLCYVGFSAIIRTNMYKVIHILLVKPVAFQKSFCHFLQ